METLKVSKAKLLGILKENRRTHRQLFLEAQVVYKAAVISELDQMLKDARDGSKIRKHVNMAAPEDHTDDYDQLIGLLELAEDATIDLDAVEYSNYVRDKWAWSAKANRLNQAYSSSNTSPFFVGENAALPSSY